MSPALALTLAAALWISTAEAAALARVLSSHRTSTWWGLGLGLGLELGLGLGLGLGSGSGLG